jgi:hypothetical protein
MKFIGITSDDFDRIFLGNDQFLRERPDVATIFPHPQISIDGVVYAPTGDDPPESNTSDGWWYIEWESTPDTAEFDLDATPSPLYQWGGGFTMDTPPRYSFKADETPSDGLTIDTTTPDSGSTGWTRILVATRTNGTVESYGDPILIEVQSRGFASITFTIV